MARAPFYFLSGPISTRTVATIYLSLLGWQPLHTQQFPEIFDGVFFVPFSVSLKLSKALALWETAA